MKKFLFGLITGAAVFTIFMSLNVKAVDWQTAYAGQQIVSPDAILAQQAAIGQLPVTPDVLATQQAAAQQAQQIAIEQQQALQNALAIQQAAALEQQAAQQKLLQDTLIAQQAVAQQAQQSAMDAATAIQAASMASPQVDVICDTNCAEQNAILYAQKIPDFVLVDISEQRVVFYKNGMRVLSDSCVTGNASRGYNTTVGIHQILLLDRNRTLRGSYGTAFVRYWMRFTKGGQGLHDAGWRNKFGNTIYVTNGSHGCVNLTRPTAETIYNNAYLGMYVIVEN